MEFIGLKRAGDSSGLCPVAVSQSTALALVVLVILARRPGARAGAGPFLLGVVAGMLSLLATALYVLAAHAGLLTVAAVLALYPGVTLASRLY